MPEEGWKSKEGALDRTGVSIRVHTVIQETDPQSIPGQPPRPTRFPLTIRRVWPEGDLDLKLPVGIFDGGKWQEGVGCLGEVGYHSLCREKTVRETPPWASWCVLPIRAGVLLPGTCR